MIQAHKAAPWMVLVVSVVVNLIQASYNGDGTIFLERGNPGMVSCPLVASGQIQLDQIEVMYWYFPRVQNENILISYFLGNVAAQNGIPEGVYDINRNFSLVIENVSDSDEGHYYCRVKPKLEVIHPVDGHVNLRVRVSPKEPFPGVTECTERISQTACETELPYDINKPMLTCIVRDTKPAVALRWLLEYSDGDTQLISDRFTVQPSRSSQHEYIILWRNRGEYSLNTFSTSASIPIIPTKVDTLYRCQAYGEALGARNGSHVTVTVTTTHHTSQTPHFTSPEPTTTAMMATFGEESTVKDTPDNSQSAPIWLIVVVCLSLAANVGLVIAVYVFKLQMNNNHKRYRDKKVSQDEPKEGSYYPDVVIPLNGVHLD